MSWAPFGVLWSTQNSTGGGTILLTSDNLLPFLSLLFFWSSHPNCFGSKKSLKPSETWWCSMHGSRMDDTLEVQVEDIAPLCHPNVARLLGTRTTVSLCNCDIGLASSDPIGPACDWWMVFVPYLCVLFGFGTLCSALLPWRGWLV